MKKTTTVLTPQAGESCQSAADNSHASGKPTALIVKPVSPPGWRQFNRVHIILDDDPALRRCLGEPTHEVEKKDGNKVKYSAEVVMVAQAIFSEHLDATRVPKREILAKAARLLLRQSNTTTPGQPSVNQHSESCPVPTDAKEDGVPSDSVNGDEVIIQAPKSVPVEVVSPKVVKIKTNDDDEPTMPLSHQERKELQRHEKIIEHGWASIVEASLALMAIRDGRLYRGDFKTFEQYCQQRWALARSTAYQRIEFANTHLVLSAVADIPQPVNERQVRALAGLSPEDKLLVWREAVQHTPNGTPTHKDVKEARKRLGLATPASAKGGTKTEKEATGKTPGPNDTDQTNFKPKVHWQKFRDTLEQEYASWPESCRSIFVHNLRASIEGWEGTVEQTSPSMAVDQLGTADAVPAA